MDKFSYSLGLVMAQNFKQQNISGFNASDLAKGIEEGTTGDISEEKLQEANQVVQQHLAAAAMKGHEAAIEAGANFLTENGKKEGVTTLPSGLQYEVLTAGDGAIPKATDQVTTHYHGTLIDGTVFDSSIERGQPATFPVNRVIPGWTEALQLMSVGSKWRLFIPFNLAYGDQAAGDKITPFSSLVFDVELLKIN